MAATQTKPKVGAAKAGAAKTGTAKVAASKNDATTSGITSASRPLKLHHLKPAEGANKAKTRVGRGEGGKRGKTAGRGTKGTKARGSVPVGFEGGQMPLHMRLPKLKGFTNPFRVSYQVINLTRLTQLFPSGGAVGPAELVTAGVARKKERIKVLGDGDLGVKLDITAHAFSRSASEKIVAAGGTVTTL